MEIVGKTLSDGQAKRRLLITAYLLVAVPASGLLWQLLSPARQIEPQPWLPMRDALAPLPANDSSLTPPLDDEGWVDAAPAAAGQTRSVFGGRGTMPGRFADKLERLLAGRQADAATGHATAGRSRLGAFSSLFGGNSGSGGGQAGAGLSGSRFPAPTLASAGPLGSVGLVTGGASKRFSPARLQRSSGVNGFMGSGRPGGVRLMNGASLEPEFRAAASAGLPGYSAAGQPQAGGAASVGGEVGMGEGNRLDDSDNSSFSSPALPLSRVPTVPPAVAALPGMSSREPLRAAACEAFTQAALDSSALLERVRLDAMAAAGMLRSTAVQARSAAISWNGDERELNKSIDTLADRNSCMDAYGRDHCAAIKRCLEDSRQNLESLRGAFTRDISQMNSATAQLNGAPPAGESGYWSALAAINIETNVLSVSIPRHLSIVSRCEEIARQIPSRVCVQRGPRGCAKYGDFAAGNFVRERALALAGFDRNLQRPIKAGLDQSWCDRARPSCKPFDEAALLGDLTKHSDALQVFAEEAPQEPLAKTADATEHLAKAAQLLKTPAGRSSRDLVNGSLELKKAADALGDANQEWASRRDEACKGGEAAQDSLGMPGPKSAVWPPVKRGGVQEF